MNKNNGNKTKSKFWTFSMADREAYEPGDEYRDYPKTLGEFLFIIAIMVAIYAIANGGT